jgi:hypothetical protein
MDGWMDGAGVSQWGLFPFLFFRGDTIEIDHPLPRPNVEIAFSPALLCSLLTRIVEIQWEM